MDVGCHHGDLAARSGKRAFLLGSDCRGAAADCNGRSAHVAERRQTTKISRCLPVRLVSFYYRRSKASHFFFPTGGCMRHAHLASGGRYPVLRSIAILLIIASGIELIAGVVGAV